MLICRGSSRRHRAPHRYGDGLGLLSYSWQVLRPALLNSRWTSLTNASGVSGRSGSWVDVVFPALSLNNAGATAKLSGLTTADSGARYRVVASNNFGESAESGAATVTVTGSKPTITDLIDKISPLGGVNLSVDVPGDPAPVVTRQRELPTAGAVWEDLTGVGTPVSTGVGSLAVNVTGDPSPTVTWRRRGAGHWRRGPADCPR